LVVVPANQASTSASNKPKTPLDSKTNYATAFFDSIDPSATSSLIGVWGQLGAISFLLAAQSARL